VGQKSLRRNCYFWPLLSATTHLWGVKFLILLHCALCFWPPLLEDLRQTQYVGCCMTLTSTHCSADEVNGDIVVAGHCPSCWTSEVAEHACDFRCCSNWSFFKKICCCSLGLYFPLFLFCCQIWNPYTFVVRSSQPSIQVDLNSKYRKSYQIWEDTCIPFLCQKAKWWMTRYHLPTYVPDKF
jgi:hypothetical protein